MMVGCSDKDFAPDSGTNADGGEGYVGIKIQMPTMSSTRANDNFDDGEASEYRINDAIILLFQGENPTTAQFTGAFNLKNSATSSSDDNQVTTVSTRVANVTGLEDKGNLYALVMINGISNGLYTQSRPEADWMKKNGKGKTIQEFQETIIANQLYSQNKKGVDYASNIFMTNSPLSSKRGGEDNPEVISNALPVLVQLNKTTYKTESEAVENPAGIIHVERAVGKVTCSSFNTETDLSVKVGDYDYKLTVDSIWWDMAQDLAESFAVRNTNRRHVGEPEGANLWTWNLASEYANANIKYRMLGHEALASKDAITKEDVIYYRPYFCQVPGYGVGKSNADNQQSTVFENKTFVKETLYFKDAIAWKKTTTPTDKNKLTGPGAFYPRENTFPVKYMRYANTTRVGFWVSFKFNSEQPGAPALDMTTKNFYISGMDKSTIYMDDDNGDDPLKSLAYAELSNKEKYSALWAAISEALDKSEAGDVSGLNIRDLVTITMDSDLPDGPNKDGEVEIINIAFKSLSEINGTYNNHFSKLPDFDFSATILTNLNNLGNFYKYDGGKVFYEVRVKHFGDDLTPWNLDENTTATTIEQSYGPETSQNKNFLGRYGIVRNNWYDIVVNKITKLGYPRDPEEWDETWPGKPDDNKDQYLAVELRVLSWAKRSQSVEF